MVKVVPFVGFVLEMGFFFEAEKDRDLVSFEAHVELNVSVDGLSFDSS